MSPSRGYARCTTRPTRGSDQAVDGAPGAPSARAGRNFPACRRPRRTVAARGPPTQRFEPDRGGFQQPERVDVVGAGRRTPHRAPVQARRRPTAGVAGRQLADHGRGAHPLTRPHGRPDGLVAGAQTAGMGQGHHRSPGQRAGEHHGRLAGRIHRLPRSARQVHAPVSGAPIGRRSVECAQHGRPRPQRPVQPLTLRARRRRAHQRHRQNQRRPPHTVQCTTARRGKPTVDHRSVDPRGAVKSGCSRRVNWRPAARYQRADFACLPRPRWGRTACRAVPFDNGSGIAADARARPHPRPGGNRRQKDPAWP